MSAAPRYPIEGVVSWNMNTTCNYRCSYCTQRFIDDRKAWARDLPRFIAAFAALPGDWEIKLSGGEPFRHPGFLDAVRALAEAGLRVSVVSNFSASREALAAYAQATEALPGVFSASLHLEYAELDEFIDKARWFAGLHAGPLVVTCVATRETLPRLPALQARFVEAGLSFKVQPEKQDRDVIDYSPAEREALLALGGHNGLGHIDPDLSGRLCWAGARYFIVDHRGEAYRCYPARRYRQEHLGNLLDGSFSLLRDARPCAYRYCNCTVPQARGMVRLGQG
ncbi:MAG: radical SAM protein [Alphaproteobacteria bacterium]|nr:radical SAM protein [Alphaproteobacteria bacterium]MCB9797264.1 radical SAM protein [Alphaproteobacteria bacterium]